MQPLEGPHQAHATAQTLPSAARRPSPRQQHGRFSLEQYRSLLTGMLGQGHGIEALCLFLTITRDVLSELLIELNLPTPHDRPLRRSSGPHAWKYADFPILLEGWLNNWSAACIGEHLGRSRGSIWYKARKLGLPKRERRLLHWPEQASGDLLLTTGAGPERKRLPPRWFVSGTDKVLELTSKRNGLEVDWAASIEALVDIGWRIWSGQRINRIAEDYGVSYRTITSQNRWLQAKSPRSHKDLVDHFDRTRGEANAKAAKGVLTKCLTNSTFPYWRLPEKTQSNRDYRNGIGAGIKY